MDAWTCVACGEVHPIDHAGLLCARCCGMACCSCELREHMCVDEEEFGVFARSMVTWTMLDLRTGKWSVEHQMARSAASDGGG